MGFWPKSVKARLRSSSEAVAQLKNATRRLEAG